MVQRAKRVATVLAPLWALGVTGYILFGPMIRSVGVTASLTRGAAAVQSASMHHATSSWYDHFGLAPLKLLIIPVAICLPPLFARGPRSRRISLVVSTGALAVYCILSIFSIGSFYLPSAGALFAALVLDFA